MGRAIRDPWDIPTPLKLKCKMVKLMVKARVRHMVTIRVGLRLE